MSIFHPRKGQPYHEVNSLAGIDRAATLGYDEIDLDIQVTKDGHIVVCHWPRPMLRDGFRDPAKKLRRTRTVASMTWAEVSRLRAGKYRIELLDVCLQQCAKNDIGARVEPKVKTFYLKFWWELIAKSAKSHGAKVRMYALRVHAGDRQFGQKCWGAAQSAGIRGKVIR